MKVFAALGPGDIVNAHRAQIAGERNLTETSIIYSGQLVELCRQQGISLLGISHNGRFDTVSDRELQLENRPRKFENSRGLLYHLSRMSYSVYLAVRAKMFGADLAIVDSGTVQYFTLALFRVLRIPIAVNFHNTLWPNGYRPRGKLARIILLLDGWFFRKCATAALGVSPECGIQVHQLSGSALPFFEYRCQFRHVGFQSQLRTGDRTPFRVVFVGRAERSKGVLDILAIAQQLRQQSNIPILFEVCGDGGALAELRTSVEQRHLADVVLVHGRLGRPDLLQIYARAHAAIVPTRSEFCEGMPHVCAEAVLSGLPVITSRLSNALPVIGPAISAAEPENVRSFIDATLRLAEDPATYERLSGACPGLARQFLDRSQSYAAAMDRLFAQVFPNWKLLDGYDAIFARIP